MRRQQTEQALPGVFHGRDSFRPKPYLQPKGIRVFEPLSQATPIELGRWTQGDHGFELRPNVPESSAPGQRCESLETVGQASGVADDASQRRLPGVGHQRIPPGAVGAFHIDRPHDARPQVTGQLFAH
jgi:hypothetical protein